MSRYHASCLCERVTLICENVKKEFTACHCTMCTKWGGTWMAAESTGSLEIEGKDYIRIYDSSSWAERAFCSSCGTHLYYKVKTEPALYIPVGLFTDIDDFHFARQIFVDQKPRYFCFGNETLKYNSDEIPLADPPDA